jgi:chemotaxis protein MotB
MKLSLITLVALIVVASTGCVSQKKYQQLQSDYSKLQSGRAALNATNQQCQTDLSSANSRVKSLEEQIAAERSNVNSLQTALDKCLTSTSQGNVNISKLVDEINSSNKYIQHLIAAKNKSDSLNMVLTNNLTRSLSREEMKDVNVQVLKGVVYISLSDNMLYKSGSYEISPQAGSVLSKIAKIIKDYSDYDVLVEGNTDNVPINKTNIRNNWDLSALRASSVVQELQNNYGVNPSRMTAGGRGEYNPVATNDTEEGKARNRRTEIIVTPKLDQFMDLIEQAPKNDEEK